MVGVQNQKPINSPAEPVVLKLAKDIVIPVEPLLDEAARDRILGFSFRWGHDARGFTAYAESLDWCHRHMRWIAKGAKHTSSTTSLKALKHSWRRRR